MQTNEYSTVMESGEGLLIEKKSKFLGFAVQVTSQEQAVEFIESLREQHKLARHCVYAYIVREPFTVRFSDDGEPQGTAGKPILELLERRELTDVCIAVVRYFGGILLGAGGLVRAYSQSAVLALDNAKVCVMRPCVSVSIDIAYDLYGKLKYILENYTHKLVDTTYDEQVHLSLILPECDFDRLCGAVTELSAGTSIPTAVEQIFDGI